MTKQEEINAKRESTNADLKALRAKRDELSAKQTALLAETGGHTGLVDSKLTEFQGRSTELNVTVDKISGFNSELSSLDQRQSELNAELTTANPLIAGNSKKDGGNGSFGSMFVDSKEYQGFMRNGSFDTQMLNTRGGFQSSIDGYDPRRNGFGATNDILTSNTATWPTLTAPVIPLPIWVPRFQDYLPKIEAGGSPVKFRAETAYDNNAAARAEAGGLAQSDFTTSPVTENASVIGTYYKFSEELVADAPYMRSWLDTQGLLRTNVAFENALLVGNGLSSNLTGFYNRGLPNYSRLANTDNLGNQQTKIGRASCRERV